jgi:protein-S-isoprenylcysteine O-methyltransferase Ste14
VAEPSDFIDLPRVLLALGLLGVFLVRIPNAVRDYSIGAAAKFRRPLDRLVVFVLMPLFSIVVPFTWIFSSALAFADYARPDWLMLPGVALILGSLALLWRSHADLGRNYCGRLEIIKDAELVTHGVYRLARHPMYLSVYVFAVGQALLVPNWIGGPSMLVSSLLIHAVRVPREEAMMEDHYGDAWRTYRDRSNRYWPFSSRRTSHASRPGR